MAKTRKVSSKLKSGKPRANARSGKAKSKSGKRGTTPEESTTKSTKAVRLTFSYEGDKVKLISQQVVEMTVPPSDPVKGFEKHKGFWAELKSDQDKTLYRRVMHNPTGNDAEIFSDDPEQSISRAPAPKRKGIFVVVVPDAIEGQEVTLSRSSPDRRGPMRGIRALAGKPAREIARFKLKK